MVWEGEYNNKNYFIALLKYRKDHNSSLYGLRFEYKSITNLNFDVYGYRTLAVFN